MRGSVPPFMVWGVDRPHPPTPLGGGVAFRRGGPTHPNGGGGGGGVDIGPGGGL
jgi:hypothetical protein